MPPISLGSSSFFMSAMSLFTMAAASFVLVLERNIFFSSFSRNFPVPSRLLSMTLPVKPSATTTSAPPIITSLASMLPVKWRRPSSDAAWSSA